jgi:hypothetical protein
VPNGRLGCLPLPLQELAATVSVHMQHSSKVIWSFMQHHSATTLRQYAMSLAAAVSSLVTDSARGRSGGTSSSLSLSRSYASGHGDDEDVVTVTKLQFLEQQLAELRALMQSHGVTAPGANASMGDASFVADSSRVLRMAGSALGDDSMNASFTIPRSRRVHLDDSFLSQRPPVTIPSPAQSMFGDFGQPSPLPRVGTSRALSTPQSITRRDITVVASPRTAAVRPAPTTAAAPSSSAGGCTPKGAVPPPSSAATAHARTDAANVSRAAPPTPSTSAEGRTATPPPHARPACTPSMTPSAGRPNMLAVLGAAKDLQLRSVDKYAPSGTPCHPYYIKHR